MVAVSLALVVVLFLTASWRRLAASGRLWSVAACLNSLVFFGMPTMPATSPWRPLVARVLATSAAASVALVVVGVIRRRSQHETARTRPLWAGLLVIGALPAVFYAFFWAIGPLY
jgi:hypothetical protein